MLSKSIVNNKYIKEKMKPPKEKKACMQMYKIKCHI